MSRQARVVDNALVEDVTRRIVERFGPRRVIVFGSYARGEAGPDSDLDIIVEMETDKSPIQQAIEIDAIFGLRNWSMDLLVYTPEEFERQTKVLGTLPSIIKDEAKVVYERS